MASSLAWGDSQDRPSYTSDSPYLWPYTTINGHMPQLIYGLLRYNNKELLNEFVNCSMEESMAQESRAIESPRASDEGMPKSILERVQELCYAVQPVVKTT